MNLLGKLILAVIVASLVAMLVCLGLGHWAWAALAFGALVAALLAVLFWGDQIWPDPQDMRP